MRVSLFRIESGIYIGCISHRCDKTHGRGKFANARFKGRKKCLNCVASVLYVAEWNPTLRKTDYHKIGFYTPENLEKAKKLKHDLRVV